MAPLRLSDSEPFTLKPVHFGKGRAMECISATQLHGCICPGSWLVRLLHGRSTGPKELPDEAMLVKNQLCLSVLRLIDAASSMCQACFIWQIAARPRYPFNGVMQEGDYWHHPGQGVGAGAADWAQQGGATAHS